MKMNFNLNKIIAGFCVLISFISCGNEPKTGTINTEKITENKNVEMDDSECVFDTSTYKFTTEILKKHDKDIQFEWNKDKKYAITTLENGDTLILSIGGCIHFNYSAELYTAIKFDDEKELIEKTKWVANNFFNNGFDTKYDECISKNLYQKSENKDSLNIRYYEILDPDTNMTNMFYTGFTFEKLSNGERTKISIGGYVN